MERQFQRRTEDFTCEHCGAAVTGTGYTNHCPQCLTSKHVDIHPGDRMAACGGLMRPTGFEQRHGAWFVIQQCERCGHTRPNKLQSDTETSVAIELMAAAPRRY
jgi:hypothetical protein